MNAAQRIQIAGRPDQLVIRRKPLIEIPRWVVALGLLLRGLWWLTVWAIRHPLASTLLGAAAWTWITYDWQTLAYSIGFTIIGLSVGGGVWWRLHPSSCERLAFYPLLGQWRHRWVYQRSWSNAMRMCGLDKKLDHTTVVPRLRRVVCTPATDRLVVRLLLGQNPEHYRKRALDLAYSFGARSAQVFEQRPDTRPTRTGRLAWMWRRVDSWRWADRPTEVHIVIVRRDCLTEVVRPFPTADAVDLGALPIARSFLGETYRLRLLATHLLIAGASRRGKSGVIWSLIASLAPAVKVGLVRLLVIDPKGGMELAMGRSMFHQFAYKSYNHIAELLEEAVTILRDRQARYFDAARVHTASLVEPLYVLVIDELATLTRYCPDPDLRKRIEALLGLLLSQGAGVGIVVVGALQDPRKENLDLRDLFLSRILLGVTAASHVDMVLGDDMRDRGALADRLPENAKGVAYVLPDGSADPVRVRFPYLDDEEIRRMARAYAAPAPTGPLADVVPAQSNGNGNRGPLLPRALLAALHRPTGEEQ
ncbi:hypothetical cell division FtsK/SpoIIIE protein [Pilimelia anulata]|uniref:Hypothetical cell division FtsK/SpoIIIE protein n=1 Tax=Pilimelia anulata TaxID=53371 RepID=A0A8J3B2C7_9ACTN|nr:FtsK/SpoIIIE domain-containing protein [Pilimelia anulata]GGJ89020.1 hypothetical cell division FtsK/SpoIIIE protein [Pilimelia anulata]